MELPAIEPSPFDDDSWRKSHERVTKALARYGLSYQQGGRIVGGGTGGPSHSLGKILRHRDDLKSAEEEFDRTLAAVESDPATAVTAASSLLESILKIYIEEHQLLLPKKATIKPLWTVVSRHLARISHTVTAEGFGGSVGAEFLPREQVEQEQAALRPCFREARVAGTAA